MRLIASVVFNRGNANGGQTQTETENKKEPTREKAKEQKHPAAPDQ
jgi:hypothetical protein